LANSVDQAWAARGTSPGRYVVHRLNRTEYGNAVRDLLAIDVDVNSLLPSDGAEFGFDNVKQQAKPQARHNQLVDEKIGGGLACKAEAELHEIGVRRFRCPQPDCPQAIFCERLPGLLIACFSEYTRGRNSP